MKTMVDKFAEVLRSKTFVTYAAIFIALTAEFWIFASEIEMWGFWFFNASVALADAAVVTALLFLIPRRFKWLSVSAVGFLAFALWSGLLYYRYTGDALSLRLVLRSESYNEFVFGSVGELVRPKDILMLLFALLPAVTLLYRKKFEPVGAWIKIGVCALALICITFSQLAIAHYRAGWLRDLGETQTTMLDVLRQNLTDKTSHFNMLRVNGYVVYSILEVADCFKSPKVTLSNQDKAEIEVFIDKCFCPDTLNFVQNRGKNLIFIVVESLNSSIIGHRIDGRSVTPVLDSLLTLQGAISALNVKCQTAEGMSSDGQLMYNTGLLPLRKGVAVNDFADNEFIAIADVINHAAAEEFIGNDKFVWNNDRTNISFGFDKLWSKKDVIKETNKGYDSQIFEFAANRMKKLEQPFVAFISTVSSHFPYEYIDEESGWIKGSDNLARYARTINYVDREIGRFLNELAKDGLLENSVIVIASDHNAPKVNNDDMRSEPIVFIALNTGITRTVESEVNQVDVFPTLIDIMGCGDLVRWRGVGKSMLTTDRAYDASEAQRISDLIIRGNYFRAGWLIFVKRRAVRRGADFDSR